ncbi:hypothetical protein [Flavobacterium sp. I3-2]|uniref:hypothetical protein n=1 Tax=Flavobacterium sp. I3-2 TaxID=2748319 RepID=UPI0015B26728|nr:hypothetical protein [Flavobacterium sp. I3-2]
MKNKSLIIVSILFMGIGSIFYIQNSKTESNKSKVEIIDHYDFKKDSILYSDYLKQVKNQKSNFTNISEAKNFLFEIYNKNIPEYWIGTKWNFNGTTRIPNKGTIACGYFVTNTLSDVDFKIERVKLAQEVSSKMINQLCVNIKRFGDFSKLKDYINNQPDQSVFIIGLDFHTGFVLKSGNKIYFLHSNYIDNEGVIKEEIDNSIALRSTKTFMIGNLTENEELISEWIK